MTEPHPLLTFARREHIARNGGRDVVLALADADRPLTRMDLVDVTALARSTVLRALLKGREAGLLVRVRTSLQTQYRLTEDGYEFARAWKAEDEARK